MVYHKRSFQLSYLAAFILLFVSCSESQKNDSAESERMKEAKYPPLFQQVLDAHGGLEKWKQMQTLEFDLYSDSTKVDRQVIDLDSRKALVSNDTYTIGYDGNQVWYTGNEADMPGESAKFYHNLQFYFFALPFVFADPGIIYEELEPRPFQGKTYDVMRFTYESGVGDSPKDEYLIYVDQDTHQMELLLYTVTYFSGEPTDKYGARWYSEWQKVNGLLVPLVSERYQWAGDSLGKASYASGYRKVILEEKEPDQSMFLQPENAKISN